jgi:hypothetical protein
MTISFPISEAVQDPERFARRGFRIAFMGVLAIDAAGAATLHDARTDHRARVAPGPWEEWLAGALPPSSGDLRYLDDAIVCGWPQQEGEDVWIVDVWSVVVTRGKQHWFAEAPPERQVATRP